MGVENVSTSFLSLRLGRMAVFAFSMAISLFFAEIMTRITFRGPIIGNSAFSRVMLFEEGKNFKNVDSIRKYYLHINIRSETCYIIKYEPIREYSCQLETNNLRLVRRKDINPADVSEFIVGVSFTEGQGSPSWFYELESSVSLNKTTIVNGSLIDTGPL